MFSLQAISKNFFLHTDSGSEKRGGALFCDKGQYKIQDQHFQSSNEKPTAERLAQAQKMNGEKDFSSSDRFAIPESFADEFSRCEQIITYESI